MNLDSCLKVGQIVKAHGVKGEIVVDLDAHHADSLLELESVYVEINQKLIPFFIDDISVSDKRAIIKFEDIDSIEDTKSLMKKEIYASKEELPEPDEEKFFYEELIGFKVIDKSKEEVGHVIDFIERTGQDLLIIDHNGKEVYIPIDVAIILDADRKNKILSTDLPEGLLEL